MASTDLRARAEPPGGFGWASRSAPPGQSLPVAVLIGIGLLCALGGIAVALASVDAVYLAAGVIGSLLIFYDFRIGVVALMVLLPISASQLFPHEILGVTGLNPLNFLLLATLVSCLFRMSSDRRVAKLVPAPLVWMYLVPIVFAGLLGSRHVAEIAPDFFRTQVVHFYDSVGYLRDLLLKPLFLVAFGVLVGAATLRSERPMRLIYPLIVSVWVMCLLAIIYFAVSGISLNQLSGVYQRDFFNPLGLHANELGRMYAVAYALLLFMWSEGKNPRLSPLLIVSMGVIIVALALTFSRGAFLAFLLVNGLFVLWRGSAKTAAGVMLAGIAMLLVLPGAVLVRVQLGMGVDLDAISAGRINHIWLPLLPELWRSPIYGNGLSSIMWMAPMRSGQMFLVEHPHNAYLQALLDVGVLGFVLLCAFWIRVWKGFRELGRDASLAPELRGLYQGAAASIIALAVANFAGSSLMPVTDQCFLWMAVGMMYGQRLSKPGH